MQTTPGPDAPLWRLVYISTALECFAQKQLEDLTRAAAERNAELGVTGELLYCGGTFMQVLEGERETVEDLFARIEADPRHAFVKPVYRTACRSRLFAGWAMGLCNLDQDFSVASAEFLAIRDFLRACPGLDADAAARGIIGRFREVAARAA